MDDDEFLQAMDEGARTGTLPTGVLQASVHDNLVELLSPAGITLGMLGGEPGMRSGALMIGGAIGGFGGPAGTVYHDVSDRLAQRGIASLRVHGRHPGDVQSCVHDVLTMRQWWRGDEVDQVIVIGHSMGGATAITAAALDRTIAGVVTLASQTAGTEMAAQLTDRPMLLVHGRNDRVVPAFCSESIHERVAGSELVLLEGCGHVMAEAAEEVVERIVAFTLGVLGHDG